jgi:ABC-2 type transport system ATP-binding protein
VALLPEIRALLDRLDQQSIEVETLSIHTPDLDDVFLTLTGQPDKDKEPAR